MSCLGPNYLISRDKPWFRRESICTDLNNYISNNLNPDDTIYIPILKRYVLISKLDEEFKMHKKGNVLQHAHKHHTNKLTKKQIFALLSQKKWTARKTYATQSESYSNPNIHHLKRVNYNVINTNTGAQTNESISCPSYIPQTYASTLPLNNNSPSIVPNILPPPPPTPSKNKFTLPDIIPVVDNTPTNINIPDGGNLIIGTLSDICTGKTKNICDINTVFCFPSSYSNVPREKGEDKELCYTKGTPTWFEKSKINTSKSIHGNNFPNNYKGLTSAN